MAKCSICNARKGKRKCMAEDSFVCSLCCGQSRDLDKCNGCSFYKDASLSRNYRKVPYYGTKQMAGSTGLQHISDVIESTLCQFDLEGKNEFKDKMALQLLELAFDKYHFNDSELSFGDATLKIQFERMLQIIEEDLSDVSKEPLVNVMASIYRSVQRRTNGGREYLIFAQQYVGARLGRGLKALQF
ncbi:hypothetical protein QUF76_11580 [Desulfobacterales bacterium HSG16]|nr:hypothetical protein [Desulfobacterales bacterium HSG16]